jgi:hypothetical protein
LKDVFSLINLSQVQRERFCQLYKVSERVNLQFAVTEWIKLLQMSLSFLGILDGNYCDGLLCDDTVIALRTFSDTYGPFETAEVTQFKLCL